jgi:hypothetical protein
MHGEGPFYSCEHRDRRDGSGWRLVLGCARSGRARTRAMRRTTAWDLRGDDAEGVCPYVVEGGLSWTGPCGAHGHASAPWLRGYVCASTGLHRGLDAVLSAASARPVGQAARGFVIKLLAWHPGWSSDGRQRRSVDGMPRRITANSTAQGGR